VASNVNNKGGRWFYTTSPRLAATEPRLKQKKSPRNRSFQGFFWSERVDSNHRPSVADGAE